jgi:hypothetical protein
MSDLEVEIQREIERLKTIETTLDLLSKSSKKQLNHYVSSHSKSRTGEKENLSLDNLTDIKRNLFVDVEEKPKESANETEKRDQVEEIRSNVKKAKALMH